MKILVLLPLFLLAVSADMEKKLDWWENAIFYEILPRSFKDSNGDGIGDLNGITDSLKYLKTLGVGAAWLTPIFKSPHYDLGYDISDFYAIHDEYGTMEDFERLVATAKKLDIKILLDLVPNHASNESEWFEEALKGDDYYYNYFVWADPVIDDEGIMHPPNNWLSVYHKSAWEYREEVGKYYLHQFMASQPDLNYRNPHVIKEIKNIMRFWLNKGIAGFRVDAIPHLFEADKELYGGKFPDEPRANNIENDSENHRFLHHIYTVDQNETVEMVYQFREVLDEFKAKDGISRVMMTEAYSNWLMTMKYFGDAKREGAQIPFNFALISHVDESSTAPEIKQALESFLIFKPFNSSANWVAGNHDNNRVATRFDPHLVDGINMIVLLMPGIAVTYMGEEIGMMDGHIKPEEIVDRRGCNTDDPIFCWHTSRDPMRTPFQWTPYKHGGFSTANKTWLPVAANYMKLNVLGQSWIERSHLNIYRFLAKLRTEAAFKYGRYESVAFNSGVFAFRRWTNKDDIYIVVVNFKDEPYTIDLTHFENVRGQALVMVSSVHSMKETGELLNPRRIKVHNNESFVLKIL